MSSLNEVGDHTNIKRCTACKKWKNINCFRKHVGRKNSIYNQCLDCDRKLRRKAQNRPEGKALLKARCMKRRAVKLGCDDYFSPEHILKLKVQFDNCCYKCGMTEQECQEKYGSSLEIDHHYPLQRFKIPLRDNNAVLLCCGCNSSKLDQNPEDFYTVGELMYLWQAFNIINLGYLSSQI